MGFLRSTISASMPRACAACSLPSGFAVSSRSLTRAGMAASAMSKAEFSSKHRLNICASHCH